MVTQLGHLVPEGISEARHWLEELNLYSHSVPVVPASGVAQSEAQHTEC